MKISGVAWFAIPCASWIFMSLGLKKQTRHGGDYICRSMWSLADMKPVYKVTRIHTTSSFTTQRMDTIQVNKGGKSPSQKAMLPVLSSNVFPRGTV